MIDVYWNSHRKLFSIRSEGRVIDHAAFLLLEDPIFLVNPRGRERVRFTGQKEVHAVIRGAPRVPELFEVPEDAKLVTYNPFIDLHFREFETNTIVLARKQAYFTVSDNHPEVYAL